MNGHRLMIIQPDENRSLAEIARFLRRLQFLALAGLAVWLVWLLPYLGGMAAGIATG